jgi:hypothetical protein
MYWRSPLNSSLDKPFLPNGCVRVEQHLTNRISGDLGDSSALLDQFAGCFRGAASAFAPAGRFSAPFGRLRGRGSDEPSSGKTQMLFCGNWLTSSWHKAGVSPCPSSTAAYRLGDLR